MDDQHYSLHQAMERSRQTRAASLRLRDWSEQIRIDAELVRARAEYLRHRESGRSEMA
jgi:hypothetical protein